MAKNQNEKLSADVEAVLAEAEKAKLLGEVPEQSVPEHEDEVKVTVIEEGESGCDSEETEKSFGVRLKSVTEKLKANKKVVIITLAVVGAAAMAVAKFAVKTAVEEVIDSSEKKFEEAYSDTDGEQTDAPAETA
jgi:hypothetical protein